MDTARTAATSRSSRSSRSGLWLVATTCTRSLASVSASKRTPAAAGCRAISGSSMPTRGTRPVKYRWLEEGGEDAHGANCPIRHAFGIEKDLTPAKYRWPF